MDRFAALDTLLVLILIYESNITISNESGVASWWSAARTLFATFCPVIARCYYLYQRAKCFQHSQRRNCSPESGIECGCICSSSCLVTQSIECRDPAARWQKQAADFTSIIVTLDECKDNGCNFFCKLSDNCWFIPKKKLSTIYNILWKCMISKYCNIGKGHAACRIAGGKFLRFCSPISHFILTIFYEWPGVWVKHIAATATILSCTQHITWLHPGACLLRVISTPRTRKA